MGDLTFDDEEEARAMWGKLNQNWNTFLMASLPLDANADLTNLRAIIADLTTDPLPATLSEAQARIIAARVKMEGL